MANCTSCGSWIPDGQGKSCSMCYGDIHHGSDGYYRQWAEEQEQKQAEQRAEEDRQMEQEIEREQQANGG